MHHILSCQVLYDWWRQNLPQFLVDRILSRALTTIYFLGTLKGGFLLFNLRLLLLMDYIQGVTIEVGVDTFHNIAVVLSIKGLSSHFLKQGELLLFLYSLSLNPTWIFISLFEVPFPDSVVSLMLFERLLFLPVLQDHLVIIIGRMNGGEVVKRSGGLMLFDCDRIEFAVEPAI